MKTYRFYFPDGKSLDRKGEFDQHSYEKADRPIVIFTKEDGMKIRINMRLIVMVEDIE